MAEPTSSVKSKNNKALYLIVALALVVIAGAATWYFTQNKGGEAAKVINSSPEAKKALSDCNAVLSDNDLCTFAVGFGSLDKNVTLTVSGTSDEGQETTTIAYDDRGNSSMVSKTSDGESKYVTYNNASYLWNDEENTWYKYGSSSSDTNDSSNPTNFLDFDFKDKAEAEKYKNQFQKIGKEACGDLTCFKYSYKDSEDDTTSYVWFDTKDYQLQRMESSDSDGSTYTVTVQHGSVTISEPSPVKELPNYSADGSDNFDE